MADPRVLIGRKGVKYGLQKRQQPSKQPAALSAFGEDDSGDEQVAQQVKRQAEKKLRDAKVASEHAAALAEDPTVYEYDSIYDTMHAEIAAPKKQDKQQRKPKYIAALLDKAQQRKKEQDIVYERRLLKEQKKEDHLYGGKESFVTASYKKKLQEDKLWLAQEKQREELEALNDVTKRKDLSDFYLNLQSRNVAFGGSEGPAALASEATGQQSLHPMLEPSAEDVDQSIDTDIDETARSPRPEDDGKDDAEGPSHSVDCEQHARATVDDDRQHGETADAGRKRPAENDDRDRQVPFESMKEAASKDKGVTAAAPSQATGRRNDDDAITAARQRYLDRKRRRLEQS
eukprot:evm.model.scf_1229.4 EVM.evm.TU.scf_1229.4   scf_1229:25823-30148(-)